MFVFVFLHVLVIAIVFVRFGEKEGKQKNLWRIVEFGESKAGGVYRRTSAQPTQRKEEQGTGRPSVKEATEL